MICAWYLAGFRTRTRVLLRFNFDTWTPTTDPPRITSLLAPALPVEATRISTGARSSSSRFSSASSPRTGSSATVPTPTRRKSTTTSSSQTLTEHQIYKDEKHPLELLIEDGNTTQTLSGYYLEADPGPRRNRRGSSTRRSSSTSTRTSKSGSTTRSSQLTKIRNRSNVLMTTLLSFAPILLFLLILYWLFRQQIRMAGKGAMNFGKSKARMMARDKNKITFKDVAGVDEAKDEVQELVEFLKDPKKVPEARRTHPERAC